MVELIPGSAQIISLKWHKIITMHILNVYAPNDHGHIEVFWNELADIWEEENLPDPDVLLEDFNIVETCLDHLPRRSDSSGLVNAIQNLYIKLNLTDT